MNRKSFYMRSFKLGLRVSLVLLLLNGCSRQNSPHQEGQMGNTTTSSPTTQQSAQTGNTGREETRSTAQPIDERLVQANTRFGFKLFAEMVKQEQGVNVFISPASIALALAMTYNGATGTTKPAMTKALEIGALSRNELNKANAALLASLEHPGPKVQLRIANSLWARQGIPFHADFMERNHKFYQAEARVLDFHDPKAMDIINGWVKEKTRGKIDEVVKSVDLKTIFLFLINATYFKGEWKDKFDKKQTHRRSFHLSNGGAKQWPMMDRHGEYAYLETDAFQAISLPYGQGRFSMYVFLPSPNSSLESFENSLTTEHWGEWIRQFHQGLGQIVLPKITLEYKAEDILKKALATLGMGVAFQQYDARFEDMSPFRPNLYIKKIVHKTLVEVNEEGTVAAAVTAVMMAPGGARPQPFVMIVDRPFFFAIRDNETGTVLFMGSIVEPT